MKNTVCNDASSSNLKGKPMTKTIRLHWLQQVTKHVPATVKRHRPRTTHSIIVVMRLLHSAAAMSKRPSPAVEVAVARRRSGRRPPSRKRPSPAVYVLMQELRGTLSRRGPEVGWVDQDCTSILIKINNKEQDTTRTKITSTYGKCTSIECKIRAHKNNTFELKELLPSSPTLD